MSGQVNPGPAVTSAGAALASGTACTSACPVNTASATRYNGLNIGDIGAQVTWNHQVTVGGNVMWGAFNGNWGLQPKASPSQPETTTAVAWTAGVKWTIPQAPITLGTYYFNYKNQGQAGIPTQRTYQGLNVGAVYGLGPGAVLIAEYAWGQNYQGDYDFLTGATGTNANNKVQANVVTVGMSVRF